MAESAPQPRPSRESLRMLRGMGFTFARAAACALVTVALAEPAAAEEDQGGRPIKLLAGSSAAWNSNVFLTPNNVQSDYYAAPYVGLRLDKSYGQQRFLADATGTFYRYKNLTSLNYNAFEYRGAWYWHLSPHVSGTISADRTQNVNDFYDFHNQLSYVTTTEHRFADVDGWIFGGWHFLLGGFNDVYKNNQQFQAQPSTEVYGGNTGIKYVTAAGNSMATITRLSRGDYPGSSPDPVNLIDNAFTQQEYGAQSYWKLGPKSTVNGRLTWFEQQDDNFSQRNFSGVTYQLSYDWASLSGKLKLNLAAKRELGAYISDLSSYSLTNTQSFTPIWQATEKIAVRMHLERSTRSFRGPVVVPTGSSPFRGDTYLAGLLAVDWSPLRYVTLSASAQRNHRSSNIIENEFNETVGGISASVKW